MRTMPHLLKYSAVLCGLALSCLHASPVESTSSSPDWWHGDYFTGDWGGVRTQLADKGICICGSYAADIWGNTTGGLKQGSVYNGILKLGTTLDLEKLANIPGLKFQSTWLWVSGKDASPELVGNIFTISNTAGYPTFRAYELWAEQSLFQNQLSIRAGLMGADTEFATSSFGSLFLNATYGWPAWLYTNIPNGGPGLPMSALGVRVAGNPTENSTIRSGIFQGDVFPQSVNRYGFDWNLNPANGYLWLNELEIRTKLFGQPGTYKAGAWFDTANYPNPQDPAKIYNWNYGLYLIIDQKIWSPAAAPATASKDFSDKPVIAPAPDTRGLGYFCRINFSPQDRSFFSFYFDSGLTYTGLIPGRAADQIGIAMAYGSLGAPQANVFLAEGNSNVGYELQFETTYNFVVNKWFYIQPDLQYIIHPGASTTLGNAFVIGCRAGITF